MEAYVGIDVACAKGKHLPIVICTVCVRGTTGLTGTAAWTSAAPPPKPWV
jgi:hypothetical protein